MNRHHVATVLVACLCTGPAFATEHAHAAVQGTGAPVASATAARHVADARLRSAMAAVRGAVEAFEHARHGHMGPPQVRALADHLDAQVARVFSECRLEPAADASLHVLLLTIAKASRAMRATPDDFAPVTAMERAMADYALVFADDGTGEGMAR